MWHCSLAHYKELLSPSVSQLMCVHVCTLSHSVVSSFSVTSWTVANQAPLSMGSLRQQYWVAISFSRGSSQPRNQIHISCVSCIGRWILYHWATWEAPSPAHVCGAQSSVLSSSLQPHGLWPTRLLCPWDYPGKNTGVGRYFLLQRIFPAQELNLDLLQLLYWQEDSLPLYHLEIDTR